jgi:hypothetical protein
MTTSHHIYSARARSLAAALVADTFAHRHNLGKNQKAYLRAVVNYHGTGTSWVFTSRPSFNERVRASLVKKGLLIESVREITTWNNAHKHTVREVAPTAEALELFDAALQHYADE